LLKNELVLIYARTANVVMLLLLVLKRASDLGR
jgi:hypothetical protein